MQAQAGKRTFGGRFLIVVVALAILFGAAFAALVADIVDRSDATARSPVRVTDAKTSAPPQEYLPEEATDAQLRREKPIAHWNQGMGEGWIDGQHVRGKRAMDTEQMRFLEQNLYLPGDVDTKSDIRRLQQLYWELEAQRIPSSSTAPSDYQDWISGQWTSGLTER